MIFLTKLGGKRFMLNEDMIESVNQTPDTIINMTNGHSFIVMESMDEVMEKIIAFHKSCRRQPSRRGSEDV